MKKIIIIVLFFIFCLFLYGKYIEVNEIKINNYEIKANVPESFRDLKIVQFSDILYDKNEKKLDKLINIINDQNADIIIFNGDLFNNNYTYNENDLNTLKNYFSNINASYYKFAVVGDNDEKFIDEYKDLLYDSDFKLLDNENMLLFYKDNTPINIIGLRNGDNVKELLDNDVETNYNLAIIHKPDYAESLSEKGINTILSGHSLGGIINIPYVGGIIKKDGATKYINSYYKINDSELFISNGLGFENFNFRLFNSPSINVYKFTKDE